MKRMKKISKLIRAGILCIGLCLIPSVAVFAGDINAQEQRLLDAAGKQYLYDGVMYKATDSAIATARSYLLQDDVDLTKEQVDAALSQVMNMIPEAISGGYMVAVETPKPADPTPTEPVKSPEPVESTQPEETETETQIEETIEKPTQKPEETEETEETESTQPEETIEETEGSKVEEAVEVIVKPQAPPELTQEPAESSEEETTTKKIFRDKKFVDNANLMTVALAVIVVAVIVAALVLFQHKNGSKNGKSHPKKRKK